MAKDGESFFERKLSPREYWVTLTVLLASVAALSFLAVPLFTGLAASAGTKLATIRQAEISSVQDELKASEGSYASDITELAAALKDEGLDETASDLAQLTASSSGWCAVLNQDRGRLSSQTLTVRSDGSTPETFESIADATAACETEGSADD